MNLHTLQLTNVIHLPPTHITAFKKVGIETVQDLLFFFPARYEDFSVRTPIKELSAGTHTSIEGTILSVAEKKAYPKRMLFVEIVVEDNSGKTRALWMNQPYIAKALVKGATIHLSGTVKQNKKGEKYMVNPIRNTSKKRKDEHTERIISYDNSSEPLIPVYPSIRGIPARMLPLYITDVLPHISSIPETLPLHIRKTYNLPEINNALRHIHKPISMAWADAARKRFAFDEMLAIQLHRMRLRKNLSEKSSFTIPINTSIISEIEANIPFALTAAQKRASIYILKDFARTEPMARLLEGDVGSGKTLVAVIAARAITNAHLQVAYMAPTEILARQHFDEFCRQFIPFRTRIGLLTSAECRIFPSKLHDKESTRISRTQLLTWMREGTVSILIGTHALIQKDILFKNLALVIVDEQHRFGVNQRSLLMRGQKKTPHLLSMTATPIPRTLALTLYGDLEISLLDEMPPGRKSSKTHIVPPHKREHAYEFIRNNIKNGGQVFVIYPKIGIQNDSKKREKPPSLLSASMKSVVEEYERLQKKIFPECTVGMLHGKLKPKEKEDVIRKFRAGTIHILVSTSVIEVGIDIPNASIMMIEGAERFGLATLHQFRGRVGRAGQQSYCFVFTDSKTSKTTERLQALTKSKNGFELAEYDLMFRGAGELSGSSQWGVSDIGMEALRNIKMVEAARAEAEKLIIADPDLHAFPLLNARIEKLEKQIIHFE